MRARTYEEMARRRWPRAERVSGGGRFASVAYCRVVTVTLFPSRAAAESAKARIDSLGCGGRCTRRHVVVDLRSGAGVPK